MRRFGRNSGCTHGGEWRTPFSRSDNETTTNRNYLSLRSSQLDSMPRIDVTITSFRPLPRGQISPDSGGKCLRSRQKGGRFAASEVDFCEAKRLGEFWDNTLRLWLTPQTPPSKREALLHLKSKIQGINGRVLGGVPIKTGAHPIPLVAGALIQGDGGGVGHPHL